MAYMVVWTEWPCGGDPSDHYAICETEREAYDRYNMLWRNGQDVWCAAYSKVVLATEPHWLDDVSGSLVDQCPPTDASSTELAVGETE